eukprot:1066564-Amphidinium_carterae.1
MQEALEKHCDVTFSCEPIGTLPHTVQPKAVPVHLVFLWKFVLRRFVNQLQLPCHGRLCEARVMAAGFDACAFSGARWGLASQL